MLELRNCTLPNQDRVTIRIANGKITYIGPNVNGANFLDLTDLIVLPGIIDTHVHDRTPGDDEAEDPQSLRRACDAGGITYIGVKPNTKPALTTAEGIDTKYELLGSIGEQTKVWFGATPNNAREIRQAAPDPRVCGIKMFMGSSSGDLLVAEEEDQYRVGEIAAETGLTLAVHAEDEDMMERNHRLLGRQPLLTDHCLIRAPDVEISGVQRACDIALRTGCKLHLCHVSLPRSVEIAKDAKDKGARITVEVCPRHLFLSNRNLSFPPNESYAGYFKVNPPLRTAKEIEALRKLLSNPDMVDTIGSDHAPHRKNLKQGANYNEVPSGMPEVQTSLSLMLTLANQGYLTLPRLVELMATNPAQLLNLAQKGKIEIGADADLVVCGLTQSEILNAQDMHYRCGWTPYHGRRVAGVPRLVIRSGKVVYAKPA